MNKIKQKFSWDGVKDDKTMDVDRDKFLSNEIFTLDCYEHIYPVKEGDVVRFRCKYRPFYMEDYG